MNVKTKIIAVALSAVMAMPFALSACANDGPDEEVSYELTLNYNYDGARNSYAYSNSDGSVDKPNDATRTGYSFAGWYTAAEGGELVDFSNFTMTSDMTLYAHWTVGVYTVTFDWEVTGSSKVEYSMEYNSEIGSDKVPDADDAPENDGYRFVSWRTGKSETSPVAEFPATVTGDITYYANWVSSDVDTYTVAFDYNYETTEKIDPISFTPNVDKNITFPKDIERVGYNFLGWAQDPAATKAEYKGGARYVPTASTTFYAVWEQQKYQVIFYNVQQSGITLENKELKNIKNLTYNSTVAASDIPATPTREGYTFDGWYDSPTAGKEYDVSNGLTITETLTLYTHWKACDVTQTDGIFEAEYVYINPTDTYKGDSGSTSGYGIIAGVDATSEVKASGHLPTNSGFASSKGFYLTYTCTANASFTFVINSDKAVKGANISLCLGSELGTVVNLGPTNQSNTFVSGGTYGFSVEVNGTALNYTPFALANSKNHTEYQLSATIDLKAGENKITLTVANSVVPGGTKTGVGPTIDYIKISNAGGAVLTWNPYYDNIYRASSNGGVGKDS